MDSLEEDFIWHQLSSDNKILLYFYFCINYNVFKFVHMCLSCFTPLAYLPEDRCYVTSIPNN